MAKNTAENINILARFLGERDIDELSRAALLQKYNIEKADVCVLIGGCVLEGADLFAKAMRDGIAGTYVIIGGAGHTTETFRRRVHAEYPFIETAGLSEAEVFQEYLQKVHGCSADLLETQSTNCGNNITNLIALLKEKGVQYKSIILCQDATMQRRIGAVWRKYSDVQAINFAAYRAEVTEGPGGPVYTGEIHGMWDMERFVSLLLGEIPRLTDDENGYGPNGKDFIAHVDVPEEVTRAYEELKSIYAGREI